MIVSRRERAGDRLLVTGYPLPTDFFGLWSHTPVQDIWHGSKIIDLKAYYRYQGSHLREEGVNER